MHHDLQLTMREAMELVKSGNLAAATEVIQRGVRGADTTPPFSAAPEPEHDYIEGAFHTIEPPNAQPEARSCTGAVPDPAPSTGEAQFAEHAYRGVAGSRQFKLFVPSAYCGQSLPLVVMLHGCTQSPDDFATGTRMNMFAEQHSCFVAYPAQHSSANVSKCWNWFKTADQSRDQGEPAIIAGLVRELLSKYSIDADRVYVAGMSAGGAMAVVLGATYPDLFAAVGVHSGLPYKSAHDLPSALAAMSRAAPPGVMDAGAGYVKGRTPPTIVFHGDRDATVHPCNGENVASEAAHAEIDHPAGTRELTRTCVERVAEDTTGSHPFTRTTFTSPAGETLVEHWLVHGGTHVWFGGDRRGSYTDTRGPDASAAMIRFFLERSKTRSVSAG